MGTSRTGATVTSKYHAQPIEADGIRFASRAEYRRYQELRLLEAAREIRSLEVHPRFALYAPVFEDNEFAIIQEKAPKRVHPDQPSCPAIEAIQLVGHYTADFSYMRPGAAGLIVEDVKSPSTRMKADYRLRKRIVEANYGITVVEVMQ